MLTILSHPRLAAALSGLLLAAAVIPARAEPPEPDVVPPSALVWWPEARLFPAVHGESNAVVRTPAFRPGFAWSEAVVSWNTATLDGLTVRARPIWGAEPGPWLRVAQWARDTNAAPRTSPAARRNDTAWVDTDIVRVTQPADAIEVEVEVAAAPGVAPRIPSDLRLGVSVLGSGANMPVPARHRAAWGTRLAIPVRSQAEYPEGIHSWCSPTSLSMILAGWAERLDRGDLLQSVPQVARGVHDPGWPGTGNWSFNAAYAGQHPGLSACVARLAGIADLERWIEAGLPVAVSVSYAQLKGAEKPRPGDGHLVVVTGFTPTGDVQVNDPGVRRDRVERVVPRADFARAWAHSSRTAYLVWPTHRPLPDGGGGRWPENR